MKKIIAVSLVLGLMLMSFGIVVAGKNQKQEKVFTLPEKAKEVAPGVFYLGKAFDKGRIVEGYAFMIKDNMNKQAKGTGKTRLPKVSSCYTFLASGAKWKSVENYIVNPVNTRELNELFVRSNLAKDIGKWETASGADILGDEIEGIVDGDNIGNLNNQNEVMFADIDSPGAIGVTIVWGIFGGRPSNRVLVEWDMVFDDADFDWSAIGEAGKMDFENIATHELGHAVGMGDLYNSECSEQTMYGYASYGETKKRDLNTGDIAGINKLY